jgi:hypothetical protein
VNVYYFLAKSWSLASKEDKTILRNIQDVISCTQFSSLISVTPQLYEHTLSKRKPSYIRSISTIIHVFMLLMACIFLIFTAFRILYIPSIVFFRNALQTEALTYTRIHSPLWTHACTPYPYEHLWKTEPVDRVLKLTKSHRVPRYRWERRLLLKGYFVFMRHIDIKSGIWTLIS